MTEQTMLIDDRGDGTVIVTINRPERLNALDDNMVDELSHTFDALGGNPACRVIILTGAGIALATDIRIADAALEMARAITANSPFGVRMTKRVAWANLENDFGEAIALENRTQILATMTDDSREAKLAFVEKRPPQFTPPPTA